MIITDTNTIYVHYGNDHFEKREVDLSIKGFVTKPLKAAIWGSPENAEFSWRDWSEGEHWNLGALEKSFRFKLKGDSKILFIRSKKDIDELDESLKTNTSAIEKHYSGLTSVSSLIMSMLGSITPEKYNTIDFAKLRENGIDAVEIEYNGYTRDAFYGWDCDSICVLNPDAVEEVKEKDKIRIEKQNDSNQSRYLDWLAESKGCVTVKDLLNKDLLKKEFGNFRLCGIINNDDDKECYLLISDAAYGHLTLTDNLKIKTDSPKFIKFEWFVVSDQIIVSSGYETTLGPQEIKYFEEKVQDFITNFIETESSTAVKYTHQYIYDGSKLIDIDTDIKICSNCQASFKDVFRHQFGIASYDFDIELEKAEEELLK
jgi:hypothetical protein